MDGAKIKINRRENENIKKIPECIKAIQKKTEDILQFRTQCVSSGSILIEFLLYSSFLWSRFGRTFFSKTPRPCGLRAAVLFSDGIPVPGELSETKVTVDHCYVALRIFRMPSDEVRAHYIGLAAIWASIIIFSCVSASVWRVSQTSIFHVFSCQGENIQVLVFDPKDRNKFYFKYQNYLSATKNFLLEVTNWGNDLLENWTWWRSSLHFMVPFFARTFIFNLSLFAFSYFRIFSLTSRRGHPAVLRNAQNGNRYRPRCPFKITG